MRKNPIRQAWAEERPAFGVWLALPGAPGAEMAANPALDYVCVDQQHGMIDYPAFVSMTQAIDLRGPAPITRVPASQPWMIGKVLDAGALGIVVPMVSSRAEAEAIVAACRYPPDGVRSYGPIRAAMSLGSRDPSDLQSEPVILAMIESREGIENVDVIASTPGLDGIYIGPADLALALGLPPDLDKTDAEHVAAVTRIRDACLEHGIAPGIQCGSGEAARRYADDGFTLITVTKDSALITAGVARELAAAQGQDRDVTVAYT